ncbi:MAG TPA: hypothetical protein VHA37_03425 [Candidatus Saccharimonadales bacterium]|nr:hypothetical protein [Candidatus Saccharimonadales bacterium]
MPNMEEFQDLSETGQESVRDLLRIAMVRGTTGAPDVDPTDPIAETPAVTPEGMADAYDEAALLLPIMEELDNPNSGAGFLD